jgi:hypothetical protein
VQREPPQRRWFYVALTPYFVPQTPIHLVGEDFARHERTHHHKPVSSKESVFRVAEPGAGLKDCRRGRGGSPAFEREHKTLQEHGVNFSELTIAQFVIELLRN